MWDRARERKTHISPSFSINTTTSSCANCLMYCAKLSNPLFHFCLRAERDLHVSTYLMMASLRNEMLLTMFQKPLKWVRM